jgi:hypothetical protein
MAAQAQVLAVLEFRDKVPPEQRIDAAYLSDQVRSAVKSELPGLRVITRENMLVLLQASGKKLEECEGECEVDTGRRIGADLVVSGELLRFGTQYKLNMKLHDTRSGELLSGEVAGGATADDLDRDLRPAVARLLAPLLQMQVSERRGQAEQAPPPAQPAPAGSAAPASPFAFGAHVMLGYGDSTKSASLLGSASDTSWAAGGGVEAGVNVSPIVTLALGGELISLPGNSETLIAGVGLLRLRATRELSLAMGLGAGNLGDVAAGWVFLLELDYLVAGPLGLHAQFAGMHQTGGGGLFSGEGYAYAGGAGVSVLF